MYRSGCLVLSASLFYLELVCGIPSMLGGRPPNTKILGFGG